MTPSFIKRIKLKLEMAPFEYRGALSLDTNSYEIIALKLDNKVLKILII